MDKSINRSDQETQDKGLINFRCLSQLSFKSSWDTWYNNWQNIATQSQFYRKMNHIGREKNAPNLYVEFQQMHLKN